MGVSARTVRIPTWTVCMGSWVCSRVCTNGAKNRNVTDTQSDRVRNGDNEWKLQSETKMMLCVCGERERWILSALGIEMYRSSDNKLKIQMLSISLNGFFLSHLFCYLFVLFATFRVSFPLFTLMPSCTLYLCFKLSPAIAMCFSMCVSISLCVRYFQSRNVGSHLLFSIP